MTAHGVFLRSIYGDMGMRPSMADPGLGHVLQPAVRACVPALDRQGRLPHLGFRQAHLMPGIGGRP
jgi:hypothetical protein